MTKTALGSGVELYGLEIVQPQHEKPSSAPVADPHYRPRKHTGPQRIFTPQKVDPPFRPQPKAEPGVMAFVILTPRRAPQLTTLNGKSSEAQKDFQRAFVRARKSNSFLTKKAKIVDVVVHGDPREIVHIPDFDELLQLSKTSVVGIRMVRAPNTRG